MRRRDGSSARRHSSKRHLSTDLATCEHRDPKGLYAKARRDEIPDFTGVSAPYEVPEDADVVLDTAKEDLETCVARLLEFALPPRSGSDDRQGPPRRQG